jgi:NADPH-dependent ferric siderophore reductase
VEEVERISAGLIRIVFGGDGLEDFAAGEFTDHYVKLHFPPPGAGYAPPFDPAHIRATAPREHWPLTRTYTVRVWDPEQRRLTIDFVVHGDSGVAGPWAVAAQPGDVVQFAGPGGAYRPDPEVGLHLFVGDESALPAIGASLAEVPSHRRALVVLQVPGPEHRLELSSPADVELQWLGGDDELAVLRAVEALTLPEDDVQGFVHGEAAMVRAVRRHLLAERRLPRERLSVSGYWKRDRDEDGWRADKPEWNRQAEADVAA